MSAPIVAITHQEAREALQRSGYLLEGRLEQLLRRRGHYVETNAPYPDPITGKTREIDLYAMAAEKAGPGEYDYFFQVVLVECINNPQPLVLFTKEPQVGGFLHYDDIHLAGLPVKIFHDAGWKPVMFPGDHALDLLPLAGPGRDMI